MHLDAARTGGEKREAGSCLELHEEDMVKSGKQAEMAGQRKGGLVRAIPRKIQ